MQKSKHSVFKYLRQNQTHLRADLYRGAADAVYEADEPHIDAREIGRRIILPSSFVSGSRYIHQQFQDAMGIVRQRSKPDLFIAFTFPKFSNRKVLKYRFVNHCLVFSCYFPPSTSS